MAASAYIKRLKGTQFVINMLESRVQQDFLCVCGCVCMEQDRKIFFQYKVKGR